MFSFRAKSDARFRSADRDRETDERRLAPILNAVREALVAAERERSALGQRLEQARTRATILAGTDAGYLNSYCYPGLALHEELALMVKYGMTPQQALKASMINGPKFLQQKGYGAVAPGMHADLLLLDANPLEDIHNTQKIRGLVSGGRWRDRAQLDELLAEFPDAKLRVQVVWEPVLKSDIGPPVSRVLGMLEDRRVTQYWDPGLVISTDLTRSVNENPKKYGREEQLPPDFIAWDVVAVFAKSAQWERDLPTPAHYDGPVVNAIDSTRQAIADELAELPGATE